ncbi:MAG: hypothetical protein IAE78_09570 [Myxococcus sp.]|nr:hypothetical protein [Myxococcus sp.]
MTRWFAPALVALIGLAPVAFADKPRRGLQTFEQDSTEVKDVNKRPSKMKGWVEAEEEPEFEFPWKQLLGALACFAIAAPFAYKLYQNVNGEIAASKEDKFGDPDVDARPAAPARVRRKLTGERPSTGS